MKVILKLGLVVCSLCFAWTDLFGTHIVGGEIFYNSEGSENGVPLYRITLKVYRDCGPDNVNGTGFDAFAYVRIFHSGGAEFTTLSLVLPPIISVPVIIDNPCLEAPPSICVEEAIYEGLIALPPTEAGYDIVYQRCCRNPTIVNIQIPEDYGSTYFAHIPGTDELDCSTNPFECNSSPNFTNYPPLVLCLNEPFIFDHSAIDADGDELVYELCTPYHGGSVVNPQPSAPGTIPADPPPFNNVIWNTGYSDDNQMDASPPFEIHPHTGLLQGTPTQVGKYVVGICVSEYRDGVLIGENKRDFQFNITSCDIIVSTEIQPQADFCEGLDVVFENVSVKAESYLWDFGVPGIDDDTSSLSAPMYTFPDSGIYPVTLIINPGSACSDTDSVDFSVYPLMVPHFERPEAQCLDGNNFDLVAGGYYGSQASFKWDWGDFASPTESTGQAASVSFDTSASHPVTLTIFENNCEKSHTDTIFVYSNPTADFEVVSENTCLPVNIQFSNLSTGASPLSFSWDFGDGETSIEENPEHSYDEGDLYDVELTVSTSEKCIDTVTVKKIGLLDIKPRPKALLAIAPEKASMFDREFEFRNESNAIYPCVLDVGDGQSYDGCDVNHIYADTGTYTIMQIVSNSVGCFDTARYSVEVEPEILIYIPNAFSPDESGLNDEFEIKIYGAKYYDLTVYDRWGKVVFEGKEDRPFWDGMIGNRLAPLGTYTYLIEMTGFDGEAQNYTGKITLLK